MHKEDINHALQGMDYKKKITTQDKEDKILYQRAKDLVMFLYSTGQIKEVPTEEKMLDCWNKLRNKKKHRKVL